MPGEGTTHGGRSSDGGNSPIRVLHVDDEPDFLELISTVLGRISDEFTVVTATSVPEGLDRLDGDSFDCIVSDYKLPDRNGIAFLRAVRETHPEIPFLLFTGKGGEDVASKAISAGVTDYLQKGVVVDQYELLANRIRNAVEQYRARRELEDLQRRYKRVAGASADAFADWDIRTDDLWWSEGLRRTFGYTSEEPDYDFAWWKARVHPQDRQRVQASLQNTFAEQEEFFEVEHRFRRADGTYAYIISRGYITYEQGDPVRATGALIDITDREQREQTLAQLHRVSRELLQAETIRGICTIAVEAAHDILEFSAIGLYLWNESEGMLEPCASTSDWEDLFDELPTFTPGSGVAWDVFLDGETRVFDDIGDQEGAFDQEASIGSELVVPLGEYGVFLSSATAKGAFSDQDVQFAETLTATTTAALQRAKREEGLREKERLLQERNTDLTRLHRVNTILRTIQRDVVQASTRGEIEQAVCDDLVEVDHYQFAWLATVDESDQLSPRAWSGSDGGYLDELLADGTRAEPESQLPARRALETDEVVSIHRFRAQLSERPWLRKALDRGFQSLIAIPLSFKDNGYGVIEIYADQPTGFTDDEREILREVSDFVSNALNAVERRQALITESNVELEFQVEDVDDVLFRLARHTGCTLDLNRMFPQPGGEWLLYVTVSDCNPEALSGAAERLVTVDRVTPIEESADLFEVVVSEFETTMMLGEQGATLHALQAGPVGGYIVIHPPQTADVSSVIDPYTSTFPTATLARRSEITANESSVERVAVDELTERQLDVLEIAYRNGFFEWPRESTGEEMADRLDVSPPTFHRHVRTGTRKLLRSIFT